MKIKQTYNRIEIKMMVYVHNYFHKNTLKLIYELIFVYLLMVKLVQKLFIQIYYIIVHVTFLDIEKEKEKVQF